MRNDVRDLRSGRGLSQQDLARAMDVSRQTMTNVEAVTPKGKAPVNLFGHRRNFPDATFTDVVRPNADTLYSSLWFDVKILCQTLWKSVVHEHSA